jgi:hypothetical protein
MIHPAKRALLTHVAHTCARIGEVRGGNPHANPAFLHWIQVSRRAYFVLHVGLT